MNAESIPTPATATLSQLALSQVLPLAVAVSRQRRFTRECLLFRANRHAHLPDFPPPRVLPVAVFRVLTHFSLDRAQLFPYYAENNTMGNTCKLTSLSLLLLAAPAARHGM